MPTYSFKCSQCLHKWREFVWINEKDKVKCPICGGDAISDYDDTSESHIMIQGRGFYQERQVR